MKEAITHPIAKKYYWYSQQNKEIKSIKKIDTSSGNKYDKVKSLDKSRSTQRAETEDKLKTVDKLRSISSANLSEKVPK